MMLSAELFEWMIATIESAPTRARLDLRRAERVALRGSIEVFLLQQEPQESSYGSAGDPAAVAAASVRDNIEGPFTAGVRDVSANGIRLEIPARVRDQQKVLLRLPQSNGMPLMLLSEVVHCGWNGTFSNVGLRFVRCVDPAAEETADDRAASSSGTIAIPAKPAPTEPPVAPACTF